MVGFVIGSRVVTRRHANVPLSSVVLSPCVNLGIIMLLVTQKVLLLHGDVA